MAIPKRIPVARDAGDHSACIGFYALNVEDNQFWGRVVSARPASDDAPERWYAVLHKFDGWGKHLETDAWFAGTSADGEKTVRTRAEEKLDEMVAALGELEWADIKIGLFQVTVDGHVFGLIDVSAPTDGTATDRVAMEPGNLLFRAPWNGNYAT